MRARRSPYTQIRRRPPQQRIVGTGNTNADAFPDGALSPPKALAQPSHAKPSKE